MIGGPFFGFVYSVKENRRGHLIRLVMPGIIIFRRRWAFGSDDAVLPALILVFLHIWWLVEFVVKYEKIEFNKQQTCSVDLKNMLLGNIIIESVALLLESIAAVVSLRGGILDTQLRASMQYLVYTRLVVLIMETTWAIIATKWLVNHYTTCGPDLARDIVLGWLICFYSAILTFVLLLWCIFDSAGGKLVKIQRYQEKQKDKSRRARCQERKQRQRKAFRAYEMSWDRRFKFLCFCCAQKKGGNKNSMRDIAQILTEFFRDMDVVASDVIAGLILLRRYQKLRMFYTIQQETNEMCRCLSEILITPRTEFLQLGQPEVLAQYKQVIHYMRFALAAYGWPVYMMMNTCTGLCKLLPHLSCCCCCRCCCPQREQDYAIEENCCELNAVALKKLSGLSDAELIYITYNVDIDPTPFYVALDNKYMKIVISVRGTLTLQDALTDLKADAETIPAQPVRKDWVGHKGMVQAAMCIRKKLKEDNILEKAFKKAQFYEHVKSNTGAAVIWNSKAISVGGFETINMDNIDYLYNDFTDFSLIRTNEMFSEPSTSSEKYDIVLVGHSLGAGTAAILAILLQQEYPGLHCYAYSPPGNLLSLNCVEGTRHLITSVVVGQDVVSRIGVMQMELLRTDLVNVLKKCRTTKWKIILKALLCGSRSAVHFTHDDIKDIMTHSVMAQPSDKRKGLSDHKPLYPPGKIILVVRNHSREKRTCCQSSEPVYQAIWVDNSIFQEVLISPSMLSDHMPDNVMKSLEKNNMSPADSIPIWMTQKKKNCTLKIYHRYLCLNLPTANCMDPDLPSHNAMADQGLCCLHLDPA